MNSAHLYPAIAYDHLFMDYDKVLTLGFLYAICSRLFLDACFIFLICLSEQLEVVKTF